MRDPLSDYLALLAIGLPVLGLDIFLLMIGLYALKAARRSIDVAIENFLRWR